MLKKLSNALCAGFLVVTLLASPMYLVSCANTATQQIARVTNDPIALSRAAYLDALSTATKALEVYVYKYQEYVYAVHPEIHNQVINIVDSMDSLFVKWDAVTSAGAIMPNAEQDFEMYLNALTKLMFKVDAMIENGEIKF